MKVHRSFIVNWPVRQLGDKRVKQLRENVSPNNIIHMKKKNHDVGTSAKDKHGGISSATHKSMR